MHKHTGFIVAIVLTSLLLVGAAIMAYLSWDNGAKLANENQNLAETIISFQTQNEQLQTTLEEEMERPGPVPFYYTYAEDPFVSETELHAIDPITGEDTIIFSTEGYYTVITQPRVGWDGNILLDRIVEGDNPSYTPLLFNVKDGDELVPAPVADVLPFGRSSISISPDGRHDIALYDNVDDTERSAAFIDLVTGQRNVFARMGENSNRRYARSYSDFAGLGQFTIQWESHDCVRVWTYVVGEDESVTLDTTPLYCLSMQPIE